MHGCVSFSLCISPILFFHHFVPHKKKRVGIFVFMIFVLYLQVS